MKRLNQQGMAGVVFVGLVGGKEGVTGRAISPLTPPFHLLNSPLWAGATQYPEGILGRW